MKAIEKLREALTSFHKIFEFDLDDIRPTTYVYVKGKEVGELEDDGSTGYTYTDKKGSSKTFSKLSKVHSYLMHKYSVRQFNDLDMGHDDQIRALIDDNA